MSLITSQGSDAKQEINKGSIDLKEAYISLKSEGESIPVRVIGVADFIGYKAHGDYNKGIFNTPCLSPAGEDCPFCIAKDSGLEDWEKFYAKDRFVFAFGDLKSKTVKLLDVSKNQAKALISAIEEYKEEIKDGDIAFNLTRTGSGSSTGYALNVITPKKMIPLQEAFDTFDEHVVTMDFFEERIDLKKTRSELIQAKRIRRVLFLQYLINGRLSTHIGSTKVYADFEEACQFYRENLDVNWADVEDQTTEKNTISIQGGQLIVRLIEGSTDQILFTGKDHRKKVW